MFGKKPQTKRRRLLLAFVIGGTLGAFQLSPIALADDNVLMTTFAQDCCPPPAVPCSPTGDGYFDSQSAPMSSVPAAGDATASPSIAGDAATSSPLETSADSSPINPSPISPSTSSNLPQASAFAGGAAASSLASNTGSQGGLDAPNMLGDFPGQRVTVSSGGITDYTLPNTGNRRFKITENVSPIPQDRIYFNYNGYSEALQADNADFDALHRYTFGGEKTFADGLFSTELRMVVTDGFDATQRTGQDRGAEFGNLLFSLKSLLYSNDSLLVGGGLTFTAPTAQDVELGPTTIENETVYIGPYLGFVNNLSENWFLQGFMQTEFAAGGDSVIDAAGVEQGVLNDQHFLYTSLSLGSWLYRDTCPSACVNGVAGLLELHYSTTLNDADNFTVGASEFDPNENRRSDYLNLTSGLVFVKGLSSLRVAGGTALRDGNDDLYDGELTVQVNRFF